MIEFTGTLKSTDDVPMFVDLKFLLCGLALGILLHVFCAFGVYDSYDLRSAHGD